MKVWLARRKLTDEQRRILDAQAVNLERTPEEIIKLLTPIAAFDTTVGEVVNSTPLGCASLLAVVVFIGGLFYIGWQGWSVSLGVLLPVSLVIAVGGFKILSAAKKAEITDNLRDTALPVLRLLREDFARGEPIHFEMDLRVPTDAGKGRGASKPYKRGRYFDIVDNLFADEWLTVKGKLNDGSLLAFRIVESLRVIDRTKKGSSGKSRTSKRLAKKTDIKVQLAVRRDLYEVTAPADARVKSGPKRHVISISRRTKATDHLPVSPLLLIDAVAAAHGSVRRLGRRAAAL